MGLSFAEKWQGFWQVARAQYRHDVSTELGRWQGQLFANWVDHGLLRRRWRNEGVIAEGVYRGNHPDARNLLWWKEARGVVEVVSLRAPKDAVHAFEAETCAALGLRLRNVSLAARHAPLSEELLRLLDIFESLEGPALIHCKSGADRTGLAAAMYHIHIEGRDPEVAAKALGLKHLHVRWSKTGILDAFLEQYIARNQRDPISLRDWIACEYDPHLLTR